MPTPVTRTLVALFAFTKYQPEDASTEGLETLSHTTEAHTRLREMYASSRYRDSGFELIEIDAGGNKASVEKALKRVANQVRSSAVPVSLLMIWSGHGKTFDRMLRLATPECTREFRRDEGLPVSEVLVQVGARHCDSFAWILDCCEAGAAVADIAAEVTQQAWAGGQSGIAAFFGSQAYEHGFDGAIVSLWHRLLTVGPSREVREALATDFGDPFNPNNRMLWPEQLAQVASMEVERLREAGRRVSVPGRFSAGRPVKLFLNPYFRREAMPALVADRYAARVSRIAVETHFLPKARGIEVAERGWQFTGRVQATRNILEWRSDTSGKTKNLYLLVADGGTGKSALIGRLVALADAEYRKQIAQEGWRQAEDEAAGTVPPIDAFSAAVHLRQLSTESAANEIARLLQLPAHQTVEKTVAAAKQLAQVGDGSPPCIVFDALDEADAPIDTALRLVRPLAESGWRVLVGTRPSASVRGGEALLRALESDEGHETYWLDRDADNTADIEAYCQTRFSDGFNPQLATDANLRHLVGQRIAALANGTFLFARMACSSLLHEVTLIDEVTLEHALAGGIGGLFGAFLDRLDLQFQEEFQLQVRGATATLRALSYALGAGLPLRDGIWRAISTSLLPPGQSAALTEQHLRWVMREAGEYIVEDGDCEQAVYRLYHQCLVDYWHAKDEPLDVTSILAAHVAQVGGWRQANPYVIAFSAQHAVRARRFDVLRSILLEIDWIESRLHLSGITALLADYCLSPAEAGPDAENIGRALRLIADILMRRPEELRVQLAGRIAIDTPTMSCFMGSVRAGMRLPVVMPDIGGLRQPGALLHTLRGHKDSVTSVTWRRDGQRLVSGSWDKTLRIWDGESGALLYTLRGHEDRVNSVDWHRDGQHLVSGSSDKTIRIWDVNIGVLLHTLTGHEDRVNSVAWRRDGRRLVSGSRDKTLRVWDADVGALLHTLCGHEDTVTTVAWRRDGLHLVSGSWDKTLRIWDAETGALLHTLSGHKDVVTSVAWRRDGLRIVSASRDKSLRVWDAESGALLYKCWHKDAVTSVTWHRDGQLLVSGSWDKTLRVWDAETGSLLRTLNGHEDAVTSVAWRRDGLRLVSGGWDKTLRVWLAQSDTLLSERPQFARIKSSTINGEGNILESFVMNTDHENSVTCVAWHSDGRFLVSGSSDNTLKVWGRWRLEKHILEGHKDAVTCVALHRNGRDLVSGSSDNTVRFWSLPQSGLFGFVKIWHRHDDAVTCVAWRRDGQFLVSGSRDHTLQVLDYGSYWKRTLRGHFAAVTCVAWRRDGQRLVSGSEDKTLRVWGMKSDQSLHLLCGHEGRVTGVAWSRDGLQLVSGSCDRTLRVWDARSGELLHTLRGHEGTVTCVAWRRDCRRLVSGSDDHTVRIWDAESGAMLCTLRGHEGNVNCMIWCRDGQHIVSGSRDNTLRVWEAESGECVACLTLDASIIDLADCSTSTELRVAVGDASGRVVLAELLGITQSGTAMM